MLGVERGLALGVVSIYHDHERVLALDVGKYLKKPLPNTTLRVANMLMNLWQMMFIPFTTWSYEEQSPVLL